MTKSISIRNSNYLLAIILIVAVVSRIIAAFYLGDQVVNLPGTFDQISYHNLAVRLIGGNGFTFGEDWWPATPAGEPTAHWSYLYTSYLALIYLVFGEHPLVARLIQAILVGILHPLLAYLLGKKLFGQTVGLLASGLTAVYIYFIYYAGTLMTEPFYITAIMLSLYLAIRIADRPSTEIERANRILYSVGLGFSLTVAVMLRQLFILIIPFIFLWIWWVGYRAKYRHPSLPVWIAGFVLVIAILPITIYNYLRFDRFVLLNTNAGFAFYWSNHPIYGTKFIPLLPPEMGSYQDLIPSELFTLNEAALDQALLKRGLQFVLDDPVRYFMLSISRIPSYFMFWPSRDSGLISNVSRVFSFGIMLPFMVYGLILSVIRLTKKMGEMFTNPAVLIVGYALIYTTIHLMTWTLIRYRLPVDAVLLIFAGVAIEDLMHRIDVRQNSKRQLGLSRQS